MNNTKIFFTGVPGSRWSGIAQIIEDNVPGFNTSDRCDDKEYTHHSFSGHKGAYFGLGMEFRAELDNDYLDSAWAIPGGICLVKSHDWAYKLNELKETFPKNKIMLIYRPDMTSYAWWHEAGGFQIKYPDYKSYKDSTTMLSAIMEQNKCILQFARKHNAVWYHFGSKFVKDTFGIEIPEVSDRYTDCLITVIS